MRAPKAPLLPLIAVAVTLTLWASAFVAIRHLGGTFAPGPLALGRLAVGSIALGGVLAWRGSWVSPTPREWGGTVTIGLLWFALYSVALNAGERRVDAGTASMLIQVSPVLVALLAVLFLGERGGRWLAVGLVVAFAGTALIATSTTGDAERDVLGVALCLVAAASYAVSLVVQKPLMRRLPALQVTWLACTAGLVVCLPFTGALVDQAGAATTRDLLWVVYLGAFPTAVAFTTFAFALAHMNAGTLGVSTYLVPPITVVMSALLLDETPLPMAYVGGALCLAGVAVSRRRPRAAVVPTS